MENCNFQTTPISSMRKPGKLRQVTRASHHFPLPSPVHPGCCRAEKLRWPSPEWSRMVRNPWFLPGRWTPFSFFPIFWQFWWRPTFLSLRHLGEPFWTCGRLGNQMRWFTSDKHILYIVVSFHFPRKVRSRGLPFAAHSSGTKSPRLQTRSHPHRNPCGCSHGWKSSPSTINGWFSSKPCLITGGYLNMLHIPSGVINNAGKFPVRNRWFSSYQPRRVGGFSIHLWLLEGNHILVGGLNPSEKYEWKSVGMMTFPIWWESHIKIHGSKAPTRY